MALPDSLFSFAFRRQHLGRAFVSVVGMMVFIASFAAAAETALLIQGFLWGRAVESRLTIQIPAVGDEAPTNQAERVKQAISLLRGLPEAASVTPLAESDVLKLLQPWFEETGLLKTLPLPALIDVERKQGSLLTATRIREVLRGTIPDVRVDDHGVWTADVWTLIRGLSLLGGATIFLMALTLVISVTLICRTVVTAERDTIGLLHLLGAKDKDIAKHFQKKMRRLSLGAATSGFLAACLSGLGLLALAHPLLQLSTLSETHWLPVLGWVVVIPLGAIALSSLTVRVAVLRQLQSFP